MQQRSSRLSTFFGRALPMVVAWLPPLLAGQFADVAHAQLGTGWIETNFTKRIHLDDEAGLQTFGWTASKSVCSPTTCADYNYNGVTDTETFRIFDSRSNRSEIRLQNEYDSGIYQFEGYVKFYEPLHDESLFQIFGNSGSAATYLMMRGYRDNGGEIRVMSGSNTIATGIYGQEVRINVIHQQNVSAKFYVNGEFIYEKPDSDTEATNYWKYGVYGTTSGNVPAVVEWRGVRTFRDGLSPGVFPSPPGAHEAEYALVHGPQIASNQAGYTGSGFADFVNRSDDYVDWTVDVATPGTYDLKFRYALESGDRPLQIKVNGQEVTAALSFPATGAWDAWGFATIPSQFLQAGTNTIRATSIGLNGPNVDYLSLAPGLVGDLNFDGTLDPSDWEAYVAGGLRDLSRMSQYDAYRAGDLNNDGRNDIADMRIFITNYETANGVGSFAALLRVPEPPPIAFMILTLPLGLIITSRRRF